MAAAERSLYAFHWMEADKQIRALQDPVWRRFLSARRQLLTYLLLAPNAAQADSLEEAVVSALEVLERLPEQDLRRPWLEAELLLQRAAVLALNEEFVSAGWTFHRAYKAHKQHLVLAPSHASTRKLAGFFKLAASLAPRGYRWLFRLLGYQANVESGLRDLRAAAEQVDVLQTEAQLFAYFAERHFLPDPQPAADRVAALLAAESQVEAYHPLWLYLWSGVTLEREGAAAVLQTLREARAQAAAKRLPLLDYQQAKCLLFLGRPQQAEQRLGSFLAANASPFFQADAWLKLGFAQIWTADLHSAAYAQARESWRKAKQAKPIWIDEDRQAQREAHRYLATLPTKLTKALQQARYAFDGRAYTQALAYLAPYRQSLAAGRLGCSCPERVRLHYRLGRIYLEQDRYAASVQAFGQAQNESCNELLWQQPYAALYQAEAHAAMGAYRQALVSLNRALVYNGYSYQSGLEQRAQALQGRWEAPPR